MSSADKKKNQLTDDQKAKLERGMYQFLNSDKAVEEGNDPLIAREKFAVSLRDKKRQLIRG